MFDFLKSKPHPFIGRRVRCIEMVDEHPVEPMTEGEVYNVGFDVINVKWDNGRNVGLIMNVDKYVFVDEND